jgi:hypothetical protein
MDSRQFVNELIKNVINENLVVYKDLLENISVATDPDWKAILPFFAGLTRDQKEVIYKLIRLVEVNTVSHILGILDGNPPLSTEMAQSKFLLTVNNEKEPLNGNLLDTFWENEG